MGRRMRKGPGRHILSINFLVWSIFAHFILQINDGSDKSPKKKINWNRKNRSLNENPITAAILNRWFQMQITWNHVMSSGPFLYDAAHIVYCYE